MFCWNSILGELIFDMKYNEYETIPAQPVVTAAAVTVRVAVVSEAERARRVKLSNDILNEIGIRQIREDKR